MENFKIESNYSTEIMLEIIKYVNDVSKRIQIIKDKILFMTENEIWTGSNAEYLKNKCDYMLKKYFTECKNTSDIIRNLLKNLEEYEVLDKKVTDSLYGSMKL